MKQIEKLMLFQTKNTKPIENFCGMRNIRVELLGPEMIDAKVGDLADGVKLTAPSSMAPVPQVSIAIFSNVTSRHMDELLAEMKRENFSVTYKAAVTETNRTWTLRQLLFQMLQERLNM